MILLFVMLSAQEYSFLYFNAEGTANQHTGVKCIVLDICDLPIKFNFLDYGKLRERGLIVLATKNVF